MEIILAIICISFAALFSSLTIGLMSLDLATLKRRMTHGDIAAARVYNIRENGMFLLTTLLLGNAAASAFFSILIGDMVHTYWAVVIATGFIFLIGEILPQAIVSRFALSFGSTTAPLIRAIMWLLSPICYPISWILNRILGKEIPMSYTKRDLLSIVEDTILPESEVDQDERRIVKGAFSFSHRKVENVMTPNTVAKIVHMDDVIDLQYLLELKDSGYSRIPVSKGPNHFVGVLYLKDLIAITLPLRVREVMDPNVYFVNASDPLDSVLDKFIKTKTHLFIVMDEFGGFEGVITVEDIIEEIIGTEIMDEDDDIPDLRQAALSKKRKN
jgi:metal transporter CNNM